MITFQNISWKNFLSTGNTPTEVNFQNVPTTLIIGHNGSGKSTILDALTFCLFGKPFRKINKPQLVNSVNQKNCLVEVNFTIGKYKFNVKRGIKPAIFEVWKDGKMIDQDAKAKDLQDQLEKQILKLNYKTFTQVVILGSSTFVPFMQLSTNDRRDIIENILDIQVFTTMNTILKQKMSNLKTDLINIENKIFTNEEKIQLQESNMKRNQDSKNEQIGKYKKDIEENKQQADELNEANVAYMNSISDLQEKTKKDKTLKTKLKQLKQIHSKVTHKIEHSDETIKFFHENDVCPTCSQDIKEEYKNTVIEKRQEKADKLKEGLDELISEMEVIENDINAISEINDEISTINNKIVKNNTTISSINKYIEKINSSIKSLIDDEFESVNQEELESFKKAVTKLEKDKEKLLKMRQYFDLAGLLLKDTGIKTKIVKKYLPHMNKLINQYLSALDFYVKFTLDENFDETIKSRHRDVFSYASFSEGEKTRINLALLFSWRAIAKMKSSVNTNLLILDEVFDSSLDETGVESFMKLIRTVSGNTNIFIISHKGAPLLDKFNDTIEFSKDGNFSKIKRKET